VDDRAAARRAAAAGLAPPPLSAYRLEPGGRGGLLLGYAAASPGRLRDGVRRLAAALG
jgi:GntR family transcriptional regulator/MocR family aminotransferase